MTYAFLTNAVPKDNEKGLMYHLKLRDEAKGFLGVPVSLSMHPEAIPAVVLVHVERSLTEDERDDLQELIDSIRV